MTVGAAGATCADFLVFDSCEASGDGADLIPCPLPLEGRGCAARVVAVGILAGNVAGILAGDVAGAAGMVAGGVWAVGVAGEVGACIACVWVNDGVASAGDIAGDIAGIVAGILAGSVARVGFMGGADRYAAGIFLDLSAGRVPCRGAGAFVIFAGIVAGIFAGDGRRLPESIGMAHVSGSECVARRGVAGFIAGDVAGILIWRR